MENTVRWKLILLMGLWMVIGMISVYGASPSEADTTKLNNKSVLKMHFNNATLDNVTAMNYPIIISEQGINHSEVKQLVYSIPKEYYEYVDIIEFVNTPICKVYDIHGQQKCYKGWSHVYWDTNHQCFDGKIILSNPNLLMHELGHIYELCKLNKDISTEEFAKNFKIK